MNIWENNYVVIFYDCGLCWEEELCIISLHKEEQIVI